MLRFAPVRVGSRVAGWLLIALAAISAVYGGYQFATGEPLLFADLGHFWYRHYPTSLQLLQPALERHVAVWLWDPVMLAVLTTPTWIVIAGLAGAVGLLGVGLVRAGRKMAIGDARH